MKKVIKVNFGVVMAVCAAFGLMSFKAVVSFEKAQGPQWYAVGSPDFTGKQPINPIALPGQPTGTCEADLQTVICAVELDNPPPMYYEDVTEDHRIAGTKDL